MADIANISSVVGQFFNGTNDLYRRLPAAEVRWVTAKRYRFVRETSGSLREGSIQAHGPFKMLLHGEVTKPQERRNLRPGKLGEANLWEAAKAEVVLESAFGGPGALAEAFANPEKGGAYDRATDDQLWGVGLRFAQEQTLQPGDALTLSRAILALTLIRAGAAPPVQGEL